MIWVLVVTALGSALVAGVMFAFSAFVMRGLASLPAVTGIVAMRAVNRDAVRPAFMLLFLGSTVLSALVVIVGLVELDGGSAALAVAGGLCYLTGSFGVTAAINVPLNNRLDAASDEDTDFWAEYVSRWTRWNHVRTFASVVAALLLVLAALAMG